MAALNLHKHLERLEKIENKSKNKLKIPFIFIDIEGVKGETKSCFCACSPNHKKAELQRLPGESEPDFKARTREWKNQLKAQAKT